MIDRELANSNTTTPECVKAAEQAIKDINLTTTWAYHTTEMLKSKSQRGQEDHRYRYAQSRFVRHNIFALLHEHLLTLE